MGRHAYLIMAHNKFEQLSFLVEMLDHPKNDIFVYVDKKAELKDTDIKMIKEAAKESNVIFVPREISVHWGDYSQIQCEIYLFGYAYNYGDYSLFHLLSGLDLPLVSQDRMHQFFEENEGKNYITHCSQKEFIEKNYIRKIKYYYFSTKVPVLSLKKIPKNCWIIYRRLEQEIQKLFRVDRTKSLIKEGASGTFRAYANWKSITKEAVKALLDNKEFIEKHFKYTFCADELYFPVIMEKANLIDTIYHYDEINDVPDELQGNLRYINWWYDWWSSHPYVWTDSEEDFKQLDYAVELGHFFARKFDLDKYPGVKKYIISRVKESR